MTFRLIIILAIFLIFGSFAAWLSGQAGSITLDLMGAQTTLNLTTSLTAIFAFLVVLLFIYEMLRAVWSWPQRWRNRRLNKRLMRGEEWIARGFAALNAGDNKTLFESYKQAERTGIENPLKELLQAEILRLKGDNEPAQKKLQALTQNPQTASSACQSLAQMAYDVADLPRALEYAQKALQITPQSEKAYEMAVQCAKNLNRYPLARQLIEAGARHNLLDQTLAKKQRAALFCAEALAMRSQSPQEAQKLATEALKLDPTLEPAALMVAATLRDAGSIKQATKMLELCWQNAPSQSIAEAYVYLREGDGAQEHLKRAQRLENLAPNHVESSLIVARQHLELNEPEKAHNALKNHHNDPRAMQLQAVIALKNGAPVQGIIAHLEEALAASGANMLRTNISEALLAKTTATAAIEQALASNTEDHLSQKIKPEPTKKTEKIKPQKAIFALPQMPDDPGIAGTKEGDDTSKPL